MSEERPPHKRQRTEEILEDAESPDVADTSGESEAGIVSATPDDKYFWQDGDCCVRVEATLFNLHRFQLSRGGSMFADMFKLANETSPAAATVEVPLVLHDEADDFRGLCWAIYASPLDLRSQEDADTVDLDKLISVFLMAQKYHFEDFETWAHDLLVEHCPVVDLWAESTPNPLLDTAPQSRLDRLLLVHKLKGTRSLLDAVCQAWLRRGKVDMQDYMAALRSAETHESMALRSRIYFALVSELPFENQGPSVAFSLQLPDGFTPVEEAHLFRGALSIAKWWRHYFRPAKIRSLPMEQECQADYHNEVCRSFWAGLWGVLQTRSIHTVIPNPVVELSFLRDEYGKRPPLYLAKYPGRTSVCGLKRAQGIMMKFYHTLGHHFT